MCRQLFGMPRSPISQVTWCADSGDSVQKSHCMWWSTRPFKSFASCFGGELVSWKGDHFEIASVACCQTEIDDAALTACQRRSMVPGSRSGRCILQFRIMKRCG